MKQRLWIIRHGETDFNRKGIVQGRGMDTDLNATGLAQAEAFYQAYRHVPFGKIFTSTLKRTEQTVSPFIRAGYCIEKLEGLDEFDWGIFEGTTFGTFHHDYRMLLQAWQSGMYNTKPPGGESPMEVAARQRIAIEYFNLAAAEDILICMHGRAMRLLLCVLLKREFREMENFEHSNLSLYLLQKEQNGQWVLLKNNDTAHLSLL